MNGWWSTYARSTAQIMLLHETRLLFGGDIYKAEIIVPYG